MHVYRAPMLFLMFHLLFFESWCPPSRLSWSVNPKEPIASASPALGRQALCYHAQISNEGSGDQTQALMFDIASTSLTEQSPHPTLGCSPSPKEDIKIACKCLKICNTGSTTNHQNENQNFIVTSAHHPVRTAVIRKMKLKSTSQGAQKRKLSFAICPELSISLWPLRSFHQF